MLIDEKSTVTHAEDIIQGFPFDDHSSRPNVRSHWANRYPEFPEEFREPWSEDFKRQFFADRASNSGGSQNNTPRKAPCGCTSDEGRQSPKLNQFGLRNTVPLGQNAKPEEQRRQRSMSAPPDSRTAEKPKRFVSKCEIPMMHDPEEQRMPAHEPRPSNSTNVRVIPIHVEGRDQPVTNADVASPGNVTSGDVFFDRMNPWGFGSSQPHSPRSAQKERGPPPQQHHQKQQHQYQRPHSPQYQQHRQQQPQPKNQAPQEPMPMPMPMPPPPQQPQHPPEADEVDSKPTEATKPPEPPKDALTKVGLIQKEVDELKQQVEAFNGESRSDKQFMMLDEMLTRKLISLDDINTEGKEDVRQARKDTIRSIQRCISMLESRVPPVENKDADDSKNKETTALVPVGSMEVEKVEESNGEAESKEDGQPSGEVVQS